MVRFHVSNYGLQTLEVRNISKCMLGLDFEREKRARV